MTKTVLITGAAKRVGRSIALELADAGYDIAIHFRESAGEAQALRQQIEGLGRRAALVQADLEDEASVEALLPAAIAQLGPITALINNASTFVRDEVDDVTREGWDRQLMVNLRAPFVLMQQFARLLPADAHGAIVNILDQRVWNYTPHFVSYTVSKAGLWTLTQTMALALAPRIRVNAIGPGPALPSLRQTDEQFAQQCASTPLQRGTDPDEVARALLAILSLPAMTGQMIALDGGQHLQWAPTEQPAGPEE